MTTTTFEQQGAQEVDHWSDILARKIIKEKKPPYVITSGITLSGPVHLGTLCEAYFPTVIAAKIKQLGYDVKNYFISDDLDAFDSIPLVLEKYSKELTPHLGKPLAYVPDPTGTAKSFGDYFLNEMKDIMKQFGISPEIKQMSIEYPSGRFDRYAKLFLREFEKAKEIVAVSSARELPPEWSPLMPICEQCGKIATTVVTRFDEETYDYTCTKNVGYTKGCGYSGHNKISDHKYKITWRLHWPAWMDSFGTSAEGAGMDHHTKGGSWDTLVMVFKEIFKKEPPIGYKFGFFLLRGAKYSKSKGIGMSTSELLTLMPPEIIKYFVLRPDIDENKDFDPSSYSMLRLYEDYENISELDLTNADRAGKKKHSAYTIAGKRKWKARFIDVLLHYQIYHNWDKVTEILNDAEGVAYLSKYITNWIAKGYLPEEYSFTINPTKPPSTAGVKEFVEMLRTDMSDVDIHNAVFETAKRVNIPPAEMFKTLYRALLGKEKGPKMGKLIKAVGVDKAKNLLLSVL
jgi:lysyl-tRNA synthetase class 1